MSTFRIGSLEVNKIYAGNGQINKVYLGNTIVYDTAATTTTTTTTEEPTTTTTTTTTTTASPAAFSLVPSGWTGTGYVNDKLNSVGTLSFPWPEGSFRDATLTAAISGTLRITGIADEGGDCNLTQIRVNGVYVWSHECDTPPLDVTVAISAGHQVIFSAGGTFRNVQVWIVPSATTTTTTAAPTTTTTTTTEAPQNDSDPYASNVSLWLNFDGANGSTTFVDSSPNNYSPSSATGVTISTSQSVSGGSSASFTSGGIDYSNSPAVGFGTGDFTIEFSLRPHVPDGSFRWPLALNFGSWDNFNLAVSLFGGNSSTSELKIALGDLNNFFVYLPNLPRSQWNDFKLVRTNGVLVCEVNKVVIGTISHTTNYGSTSSLSLGANSDGRFSGGFIDELRITKGVARIFAHLPAATTVYGGAVTLTPTTNINGASATYQWQKQTGGVGSFVSINGATSDTLSLSNLTAANNNGDVYRVIVTVAGRAVGTSNTTTITVDESGINGDNRFRVTAASSTTALTAAVETTTGYWKMVSSTGQSSAVLGSQWGQYSPYYFNTGSISGLPSGQTKIIEVFSCDANGNPSGELEYVSFAPSSQGIVAADASGCTSLRGFNLSSSATPYNSWFGVSQMPATLVSVRAVGVAGNNGSYSQSGPYPATAVGGINIAGQSLSAAALNQLYTDLANGTNTARIFVGGNPGTSSDNTSIATAKNYTVFGS